MSTRLTAPNRVLSWWWSMLRMCAPFALEEVDRHPVDVAAVEEHQRAVGDVRRRLVEDVGQGQEAVLERQRELLRRQEHHRVLARAARGSDGARGASRGHRRPGPSWVVRRKRSPSRSSARRARGRPWSRARCSFVEQPGGARRAPACRRRRNFRVGVRFIRVWRATADCRTPCADASAFERRLALRLVAEHAHEDPRRAQVGAGLYGGHGHESDPGILELTGDGVPDHLAHDLVYTPHALCGHGALSITVEPSPTRGRRARSVADVLEGPQRAREPGAVRAARLDEALDLVGAVAHAPRRPRARSGASCAAMCRGPRSRRRRRRSGAGARSFSDFSSLRLPLRSCDSPKWSRASIRQTKGRNALRVERLLDLLGA